MLCPHVPSSWCSVLLQSCSYHQLSVQNIGWRVHTVNTQHLQHVSRVTCHCTVGHVPALRDVIVNHCQRCFNWPHALNTKHRALSIQAHSLHNTNINQNIWSCGAGENRTRTLSHIKTRDPSEGWSPVPDCSPRQCHGPLCAPEQHPCLMATISTCSISATAGDNQAW